VLTLSGYGTAIRVERGHLIVEDGIGTQRFKGRFSRIGHGLERLVAIGSDGIVSLSALRWLADQNASFVMLERNGSVLLTTGPVRPSDIKLRRAQALAHHSGLALRMSREIIDRKLSGQKRVALEVIHDQNAAMKIERYRSELGETNSLDQILGVESHAAGTYWAAWRDLAIAFPDKESRLVPDHWRAFGHRVSPLTGSPRLAVNPINAILNYLYALLEAECRLAVVALGLDPEMGFLHNDAINRDSLACDLMEAVRPDVDAYVLKNIVCRQIKRSWFFEERNGNCRLMAEFASQLAETAPTWARLVAPLAEWVVNEVASTAKSRKIAPATRLTQNRKREVKGGVPFSAPKDFVKLQKMCRSCGAEISEESGKCKRCNIEDSAQRLTEAAATQGRIASHTIEAEAKRSETQRAMNAARKAWSIDDQPSWLTATFYAEHIKPQLACLGHRKIAACIGVSCAYGAQIRDGRLPHERHWLALAKLVNVDRQSISGSCTALQTLH
jgi:CRISPR-associated protein Cas1